MIVSEQLMVVEKEVDAEFIDASMPFVVKDFERQVLNEKSDIVGFEGVQDAANIYLEAVKANAARRRILISGISGWIFSDADLSNAAFPFPGDQVQRINFTSRWPPGTGMSVACQMSFNVSQI